MDLFPYIVCIFVLIYDVPTVNFENIVTPV